MACSESIDNVFGPWAGPFCRGGVDFTFLFEMVFFTIIPDVLFILVAIWQMRPWKTRVVVTRTGIVHTAKLIVIATLEALSVAYLSLVAANRQTYHAYVVAAASVECVAVLAVGLLSRYSHTRSPRPSLAIVVYLCIIILFNLATARTLWLMKNAAAVSILYTVTLSVKMVCLVFESLEKHRLLIHPSDYGPEELAGPLSRTFFIWVLSLFRAGYAALLTIPQLLPLSADMKSLQLSKKLVSIDQQTKKQSLFSQLVTRFSQACLLPIIPRVCLLAFTLAQPFLIYTSVDYISTPRAERNEDAGKLVIFAYLLSFIGYSLSNALYWHLVNRLMMKVRGSLISLIYSTTFRSGSSFSNDTASLTLMTVDVDKVMIAFEDIHELWANVVHVGIAVYVLALQMSWACVAPIFVCIVCFSVTVPIANKVGTAQKTWNHAVQERVSLAATVIRHLKEVHMLGFGSGASALLQTMRLNEISKSQTYRRLMSCVLVLSHGTTALGPFATFALYAVVTQISGNKVLAAKSFASLSLITMIATPFSTLVQALPSFVAGISSLSRIENYASSLVSSTSLPTGEKPDSSGQRLDSKSDLEQSAKNLGACQASDAVVSIQNGRFGWSSDGLVLDQVELKIHPGSVTAVMGPVGSGKSMLLHGILKQCPMAEGDVSVRWSRVAFCPQQPWLVSGTIRRNIVGEQFYDASWYWDVVTACALAPDLEIFEDGDMKDVGNEGGNLSGGQRQRVALARAVYSQTDLILLDDPLSGVDPASAQDILTNLFGPNGLLLKPNKATVITSSTGSILNYANQVLLVNQHRVTVTEKSMVASNDQISRVLNTSDSYAQENNTSAKSNRALDRSEQQDNPLAITTRETDLRRKAGDFSIYWYYIRAGGVFYGGIFLVAVLLCTISMQFCVIWVQWWSDASAAGEEKSVGYYLGIYALLSVGALAGLAIASWILMVSMVSRSGARLHQSILDALFKAPASHFATIDQGVTLNRFNQDMQLVDSHLPMAVLNTALFACICLVQIVIVSIAAKYMAITIPFCLFLIYFVQSYYLKTSRQLRLLDIEAKAPLFTNFQDTIRGLSSIRAYGGKFGYFLEEEHRNLLDESQQPIFLLLTVQRWLALVLDLLVSGLTVVLIIIAVELKSGLSGSDLGVALVNLTSFNSYLTFLIRFWASMETSLGGISRIKQFSQETPIAEGDGGLIDNASSGNEDFTIKFQQVTATYEVIDAINDSQSGDSVADSAVKAALSCIDLDIKPGTKLAITGRSGSGKSSLCSTLLRLLPVRSGRITIGGVDISTLDQDLVQHRLNAVSQTTFFFGETSLRDNLEPQGIDSVPESLYKTDIKQTKVMEEVLQSLGIWDKARERGGLEANFDPSSWSVGELQLLGLSRAIIKGRWLREHPDSGWKILVLDEATSSVDEHTAALMRQHIKKEFADHTILAIMHRMEGVVEDMDEVIVLSKGQIACRGRPADILADAHAQNYIPLD